MNKIIGKKLQYNSTFVFRYGQHISTYMIAIFFQRNTAARN